MFHLFHSDLLFAWPLISLDAYLSKKLLQTCGTSSKLTSEDVLTDVNPGR